MKNFLILGLVFIFGLIVSVSVAQEQATGTVIASTVENSVTTSNIPERTTMNDCSNCDSQQTMLKTIACMPVNVAKNLASQKPVQRVVQTTNNFAGWVNCNRPVRSRVGRVFGRCR